MSEAKGLSDALKDWIGEEIPYEIAQKAAWEIIKERGYYHSPIIFHSSMEDINYYPKSNKNHVMEIYDDLTLVIIKSKGKPSSIFEFVKSKLPRI